MVHDIVYSLEVFAHKFAMRGEVLDIITRWEPGTGESRFDGSQGHRVLVLHRSCEEKGFRGHGVELVECIMGLS